MGEGDVAETCVSGRKPPCGTGGAEAGGGALTGEMLGRELYPGSRVKTSGGELPGLGDCGEEGCAVRACEACRFVAAGDEAAFLSGSGKLAVAVFGCCSPSDAVLTGIGMPSRGPGPFCRFLPTTKPTCAVHCSVDKGVAVELCTVAMFGSGFNLTKNCSGWMSREARVASAVTSLPCATDERSAHTRCWASSRRKLQRNCGSVSPCQACSKHRKL